MLYFRTLWLFQSWANFPPSLICWVKVSQACVQMDWGCVAGAGRQTPFQFDSRRDSETLHRVNDTRNTMYSQLNPDLSVWFEYCCSLWCSFEFTKTVLSLCELKYILNLFFVTGCFMWCLSFHRFSCSSCICDLLSALVYVGRASWWSERHSRQPGALLFHVPLQMSVEILTQCSCVCPFLLKPVVPALHLPTQNLMHREQQSVI